MNERELIRREVIKSPEIWRPNFGLITISGPSGTGKTTTGLEMVIRYDIPPKRFIKVGVKMRDDLGDMLGYQERPLSKDQEMDDAQTQIIRAASKDNPMVLEGRLAGILKAEELRKAKEKGIELPVISLLLYCEFKERIGRLTIRWNEDHPEAPRTSQEVKEKTLEREKGDLDTWQMAHPELNITNPFNPGLKDRDGNKVYDKSFSTTGKSVEKVVEEIHRYLRMENLIKRIA